MYAAKGVEMLRYERRLIGLFLPIALLGILCLASSASAQKVRVETRAYTPLNLSLVADSPAITVCESISRSVVQLNARATSDNYRLAGGRGGQKKERGMLPGISPRSPRLPPYVESIRAAATRPATLRDGCFGDRCTTPPHVTNVGIICPDQVVWES